VPASHTLSFTSSARGTISALPSRASSIVPSDSPSRLWGSRKLRTWGREGEEGREIDCGRIVRAQLLRLCHSMPTQDIM
jgi:hypothetical protein